MNKVTLGNVLSANFVFVLIVCFATAGPVLAGSCVPYWTQQIFKKVYRTHKIYFEGLADINGDGKLDAYGYALQPNDTYRNIVYVLNNGTGGFGDPVVINTSFDLLAEDGDDRRNYFDRNYHAVVAGNLNNDGVLDFVARKSGDSSQMSFVTFLSGPGGTYTEGTSTLGPYYGHVAEIADFNGDGRGDMFVVDILPTSSVNLMTLRLANSDGTYGDRLPVTALREQVSPVVDDFSGDGKPDIAFGANFNGITNHLRVLINNGNATFTELPTVNTANHGLTGTADLNGDGKKDILGRSRYINDGLGNFTRSALPGAPIPDFSQTFAATWQRTGLMDYDGDGKKDLIIGITGQNFRYRIGKKYSQIYFAGGLGTPPATINYRPLLGEGTDMNGDGKDEEVIFINSYRTSPIPLSSQPRLRQSGSNEAAIIVRENLCTAPPVRGQTRYLDFGGDGISDIGLWNPDSGKWRYYSSHIEQSADWGGGAFGDVPAPGDFDGDGKTDLAVFREPEGDWWIVRSSDNTFTWTHFGLTGDKPVPADYNGDGKTDIGVFRPSEGNWYIDYTDNSNYTFLHFGTDGDIPVPADYDGDGSDNICVFRPSNGSWYYLTPTFDNYVGAPWGMNGDIPVPADYDMDGKDDFAVFRPSDKGWYMFRSYDYGFDYTSFGLGNDLPMVIDSDGDGISEIATYAPPSGSQTEGWWWAVSQPSSRFFEAWLWGAYGAGNERPLRMKLQNK
jgi:hypothetical protein